jgi:ACS family hexuronate transporter-like MFS transporter
MTDIFCKISRSLNLGNLSQPSQRLSGGFLHRMYSLTTQRGRYAVKLLNPHIMARPTAMENFRRAEAMESHLEKTSLPILPALRFGKQKMQQIDGQYFYVYEWFDGRALQDSEIRETHCRTIGAILAPILIALICASVGWKMTFIIIGILAPLWVLPWLWLRKSNPKNHPFITDEEKQYILSGQPETKVTDDKGLSWGQLLAKRKSYAVILSRFFLDPVWWMFVTWLPIYLGQKYNMDLKALAAHMWIPYVGAALGSIAGGWVSSHLVSAGKTVNFARKTSIIIGALITLPALIYVAFVQDAMVAVCCMAIILFGFQFTMNNIQTLASDMYTGKSVGSLAGLGGAAATLGTILSICFIPMLTAGDNWTPFFIMGASLVPISVCCVFLFGRNISHEA